MITLFNPELKKFYGADAEFDLFAELSSDNEKFVTIDASQGMILGKDGVAKFTFSIYATNASVKR